MISRFYGRYRFLSNFWPAVVELGGETYWTVEHAYQAAKTIVPSERIRIRNTFTPGDAKRLGKTLTLCTDWEGIKLDVMTGLVCNKFQHPQLGRWLLETDDQELIEGNNWGDTYWGVCKGAGENHLGKILMAVRNELRAVG